MDADLYRKYEELFKKSRCMSELKEGILNGIVIDQLQPKSVLEFGPFLGGWCLFVNSLLYDANKPLIPFTGVDNFFMHQYGPNTPKNETDLESYIKSVSIKEYNHDIDIKIHKVDMGSRFTSDNKYDLIRIDCSAHDADEHYRIIQRSREVVSRYGAIILDDISPIHPGKLHSFVNAYHAKEIFPFFYGYSSVICAADKNAHNVAFHRLDKLKAKLDLKMIKIERDIYSYFMLPKILSPEANAKFLVK